jgi:hypothetical protein
VPSAPNMAHQNVPQKLNGNKDVHFFSVGTLHGRTLVVYMKKKNVGVKIYPKDIPTDSVIVGQHLPSIRACG